MTLDMKEPLTINQSSTDNKLPSPLTQVIRIIGLMLIPILKGCLTSTDDYFIIDQRFVVMETTLEILVS